MTDHFDVIIVGAGLSGIGAACHLQQNCPDRTYAIVEARNAMGGTWDLFRYPGIRSDSDMYTLGYAFKPWLGENAIADGPSIRAYIEETAREHGIAERVRYGHKVKRAEWSSERARWTVEFETNPGEAPRCMTCSFLFMCAGYYRYDAGYTPEFPGLERYRGTVVHPQLWPEDLDYSGKKVVVIGSGATAMTLVPAMAERVEHVTMLQRSPTYVVSLPARDRFAHWLRRKLPASWAYAVSRWQRVLIGAFFFLLARRRPDAAKRRIVKNVEDALGADYAREHFTPRYNVWDQRVCLIPDGDLFEAIQGGKASVVTDQIKTFTERGLQLASGTELEADLIITATGLEMQFIGGTELSVDGTRIDPHQTINYKGTMLSDVPNFAVTFGYTNASWTLKADLIAQYVCRVLNHMRAVGARQCTPRAPTAMQRRPWVDFSSGYIKRGLPRFPMQGAERPWRLFQSYPLDIWMLRMGAIDDGTLIFDNPEPQSVAATVPRLPSETAGP